MTLRAAFIVAAGRRLAVVAVQPSVFSDPTEQEEITVLARRSLGVDNIVLVMFDENDVPTVMGSRDEVELLADSDFTRFPWEDYPVRLE